MADDGEEGRKARDEGIKRVKRKSEPYWSWAWSVYVDLPIGWKGIAEKANNMVMARVGHPNKYGIHSNVFGSLFMNAVKANLFEATGEWVYTINKKNHACKEPVYVRTTLRPHFEPPIPFPPSAKLLRFFSTVDEPQEPFASFMGDNQ